MQPVVHDFGNGSYALLVPEDTLLPSGPYSLSIYLHEALNRSVYLEGSTTGVVPLADPQGQQDLLDGFDLQKNHSQPVGDLRAVYKRQLNTAWVPTSQVPFGGPMKFPPNVLRKASSNCIDRLQKAIHFCGLFLDITVNQKWSTSSFLRCTGTGLGATWQFGKRPWQSCPFAMPSPRLPGARVASGYLWEAMCHVQVGLKSEDYGNFNVILDVHMLFV